MNLPKTKFLEATVTFEMAAGTLPARYRVKFAGEPNREYLVRGYDTAFPKIVAIPAPGYEVKGRGYRKEYPINPIKIRGKAVLEAVAYYVGDIDERGLYAY
ncbi:hypothetical protein [uncultured Roseibium sp.]|uniref:hypothetical protein n=1 Tax=uncultured Roseibium sp. TaxID=1936171 RepID=UPI00263429D7|nr:hypothetical protein [uncultured Roseibium sp.]